MNELTVTNNTAITSITDTNLRDITAKIVKHAVDINKNYLSIAYRLGEIKKNNYFEADFGKFENYGKKVFGFEKTKSYAMADIGTNFLEMVVDKNKKTIHSKIRGEWSVSKLTLLISFSKDAEFVNKLIISGWIRETMTVKELSEIIAIIKENIENGNINPDMTVEELADKAVEILGNPYEDENTTTVDDANTKSTNVTYKIVFEKETSRTNGSEKMTIVKCTCGKEEIEVSKLIELLEMFKSED